MGNQPALLEVSPVLAVPPQSAEGHPQSAEGHSQSTEGYSQSAVTRQSFTPFPQRSRFEWMR